MKAWNVKDKYTEYCIVVFAPTASEAKSAALSSGQFDDSEYVDLRATRLSAADSYYNGSTSPYCLDWLNQDDRFFLVKACGFRCEDFLLECCEECKAKDYCEDYQQWIEDGDSV